MIRSPVAILALLTALNLLNYIDRFIVSAVLPAMSPDLGLDKTVGGLVASVFLIGYSVTSPYFGSLGDRKPRKILIGLGVALWSIATVGSGFAVGAKSVLFARALVGVGEASYATLAPTIIDDIAPPDKRARWLSVFYVATPVGAALGYVLGGILQAKFGWRSAFFFAGGPGLLLAGLCLLIQEPKRVAATDKANILRDVRALVKMPLFRQGVAGYCMYTAAVGAFSHWAPTFLVETYPVADITREEALKRANFWFGVITVVGGIVGTAIGGIVSDRLRRKIAAPPGTDEFEREEVRILLRVCSVGSFIGAPIALACFIAPTSDLFYKLVFPCEVALFLSTSPINGVILRSVPAPVRASAMALAIFSIHAFGDSWSPTVVGTIGKWSTMQQGMYALPVTLLLSALLWWPRKNVSAKLAASS
jgi:MFS transporter, Spinster family, sphingosine-1-phosphate transporter